MTSELVREPALYVGGDWVVGGGSDCEVENPATEELAGLVTQASDADVDQAIQAAREAFPRWAGTAVADRVAALRRLHDVIAERAEVFAALINREQGSPPRVARSGRLDLATMVTGHGGLSDVEKSLQEMAVGHGIRTLVAPGEGS